MKQKPIKSPRVRTAVLMTGGLLPGSLADAAPLYSESFDSQATAKVLVNKAAHTDLSYVDYSSFVRDLTNGGGAAVIQIPEAPNRIAGSAATRGVLLSMTYGGTLRAINLLASDTAGGPAKSFSGNYRMSCDMWLSIAPDAVNGTTDVGLFGVGHSGNSLVSYLNRATAVGTYGWATSEGGIGTTGDVTLLSLLPGPPPATTAIFRKENVIDAPLFSTAFRQGSPISNTPNGQWTQVDMVVVDNKVTLYLNGVIFGTMPEAGTTDGFVTIGYEDPFTGSNPTTTSANGAIPLPRWNRQFALFDNLTVESLNGPPNLEAIAITPFPAVDLDGGSSTGEFRVATTDFANSYNITGGLIDGPDAANFKLVNPFPITVDINNPAVIPVNFTPSQPNGLRVARLKLTTSDPNLPVINYTLQGRRDVKPTKLTVSPLPPVPLSVSVVNGSNQATLSLFTTGTNPITVQAPVLTGLDAAMFNVVGTFPLVLVPGDGVTLPLAFTPTGARGVKSVKIEFATNDPDVPLLTTNFTARYAFGPPLLAHYKMDDTAGTTLVDATAVSPAATLQVREAPFEFAQPSLLPGGAGTAVRLRAPETSTTGNYAISGLAHLPNVSYSLWIQPEAKVQTTRRTLLFRSSRNLTTGTLYSLYLTSLGRLVFEVNSTTSVETEDGAIVDGTVYHIGVTHSDLDSFGVAPEVIGNTTATRTRLYVNGVMVSEKTDGVRGYTDYELTTTTEGLQIGSSTAAGAGYVGMMDDLQVYNAELASADMAGLFSEPGRTVSQLTPLDYRITGFNYQADTGTITLSWNSTPGAVYSVQASNALSGFTDIAGQTGITAFGLNASATFPADAVSRRYYQIRRTSP